MCPFHFCSFITASPNREGEMVSTTTMESPSPRRWTIDAELEGLDYDPDEEEPFVPLKNVPNGDVFEASRAGDLDRLRYLLELGVNVNARDAWDSVALYYACLAGNLDAARMLLENGAICSEHTFDGDRCHYAALNLQVRKLLKAFEARPPPLGPLQSALRDTFVGCPANRSATFLYQPPAPAGLSAQNGVSYGFPPDLTLFVHGRPIETHRVILSARSPYFKRKFEKDWKHRQEVKFSKEKLSYPALHSLIHFFYSDRLEIAVDDMEDLIRICKVCECEGLRKVLEKELIHQKYAEYKSLRDVDDSQKRFILQGLSLPEEDRLPAAMQRLLQTSLANSSVETISKNAKDVDRSSQVADDTPSYPREDLADVCISVLGKIFRCHQVVLASRSEYFKARLSRVTGFREGNAGLCSQSLPLLEEHDLSPETFEKMLEYMYTDSLKDADPDQAGEMFDAASRYLLFSMKRVAADALLPHLEMASPADLCEWLILSDMFGAWKIREYCLDAMACNFEAFADTREFRAMLLRFPPPSGDSSSRTTLPSVPGAGGTTNQGNILDDLREKWLEAEAAELDKRDESATLFDKRLEILILIGNQERIDNHQILLFMVHGDDQQPTKCE